MNKSLQILVNAIKQMTADKVLTALQTKKINDNAIN